MMVIMIMIMLGMVMRAMMKTMMMMFDIRATVEAMHKPRCGVTDWPTTGQIVQVMMIVIVMMMMMMQSCEMSRIRRIYPCKNINRCG